MYNFSDFYDPENDSSYYNYTYNVDPNTVRCETTNPEATAAVALCLVHVAIFLLAIPGNLLVGLVIGLNWNALTTSDVYLFHLTVADCLLASTLPLWAVSGVQGWVFGDLLCKVVSLTVEANFYTSVLFLACISVDRYLVIVHATSRKERKWMGSQAVCASVWAIGCALALPALSSGELPENSSPENSSGKVICTVRFDLGSATVWKHATRALRFVLGFLLPVVVMVTCYGITLSRLLQTRGFKKHRAMRVIVVVVIAFLLCWTPYHLTVVMDTVLGAKLVTFNCAVRKSVDLALVVTHTLALCHCCINPVLYAFIGEKFRRKLRMLVERKLRQERASGPRFSRSTSQMSDSSVRPTLTVL